jgi:hypothetical protein
VEWLRQADLMRRYSIHSAEMRKTMDEAKERLDVGKARIEMEIRSNPEKYGLAKITEGAIASTILLQADYQELNQAYLDARYEYEVAGAAVRAIDQKKTALENLVKLLGAQYFAGPQAPRDLSREWIEAQKHKAGNRNVRVRRKSQEG